MQTKYRSPRSTKTTQRRQSVAKLPIEDFPEIWNTLFTTPIHLDSLLSKQEKAYKGLFAQVFAQILLRPVSLGKFLGLSFPRGEPWSLSQERLSAWPQAQLMARQLSEFNLKGDSPVRPQLEDFPPWMIAEWQKDWGAKKAAELVETLGQEAPLSLRAARKVGSKKLAENLEAQLESQGGNYEIPTASDLSPLGVSFPRYQAILNLEAFTQGEFEIQDEGSQIMSLFTLWPESFAHFLNSTPGAMSLKEVERKEMGLEKRLPFVKSNWTVIDTCAGAGGKSLAMADALGGKARVYSYDIAQKKLKGLKKRTTRAKLNNIQTLLLNEDDIPNQIQKFAKSANAVLVDAPCTGWGVLRRNPDIKWRQEVSDLERMPGLQLRLLSIYSELVAPGGRLVYGVCTFRKSETIDVVRQFLVDHPHFKRTEGGFLGPGPCDGFFMQSFIRA